jgi:hypothetical protein
MVRFSSATAFVSPSLIISEEGVGFDFSSMITSCVLTIGAGGVAATGSPVSCVIKGW